MQKIGLFLRAYNNDFFFLFLLLFGQPAHGYLPEEVSLSEDCSLKAWVNPMAHLFTQDDGTFGVRVLNDGEQKFESGVSISAAVRWLDTIGLSASLNSHAKRQKGKSCNTKLPVDSFLPHAKKFEEHGIPLMKKYINVGAQNGKSDDPLYEYVKYSNATGVAIEKNAIDCAAHKKNFPNVELVCDAATPYNVADLLLYPNNKTTPLAALFVDVIKVDLDSFDSDIVEAILQAGFRSLSFIVEINPSFPPPYLFATHYHPRLHEAIIKFYNETDKQEWPLRGMSLSYAVEIMSRYGYDLVSVGHHDALFVDHRFNFVYDNVLPYSEVACYFQAFISINGIPLSLSRRLFFEFSSYEDGLDSLMRFLTHFKGSLPPEIEEMIRDINFTLAVAGEKPGKEHVTHSDIGIDLQNL